MKEEQYWIDKINNCTHRPSLDSILDQAGGEGYELFPVEFGRIIDAKLNRELYLFHLEQREGSK